MTNRTTQKARVYTGWLRLENGVEMLDNWVREDELRSPQGERPSTGTTSEPVAQSPKGSAGESPALLTSNPTTPDAWLVEWNGGRHEKLCANEHEAERESLILVEDGWEDVEVIELFRRAHETKAERPFQYRVVGWALDCFGSEDTADRAMRTYRFLEEALELAQACGCTKDAAARVLEYVYGRPTGVIKQEAGGTMVSLAVLCEAFGFGMEDAGEAELARVLGKIDHIRARHAAKPDFGSPVKSDCDLTISKAPQS